MASFCGCRRSCGDVSGFTGFTLGAITAIPFSVALVGMVVIGRHSDRTGERKGHVAACALTGAVGLVLAATFQHNVTLVVLSFTLSQLGQRSVMSVFWAIPPMFLGGTAAAAGIALINSIGNLGGFVGPTIVGWLRGSSGGYTSGLLVLAAALVIEAVVVMMLPLPAPAAAELRDTHANESTDVRGSDRVAGHPDVDRGAGEDARHLLDRR